MLSSPKQAVFEGNYDQKPRNCDQKQKKPDKIDDFVVASKVQDDLNLR